MNVSRRWPSRGFFRWNPSMACFSQSSNQKSRGPTRVPVGAAAAVRPGTEFAGRHAEVPDEPPGADLTGLRLAPVEIHDLVPHIVRHADPGQSPQDPSLGRYAPISSARTCPFRWISFSRYSIRSCSRALLPEPWAETPPPRPRRTPSDSGSNFERKTGGGWRTCCGMP
jgi:hypothetical protein